MKIGVDARPLQHQTQYRGIGRSLEYLLSAIPDYLDADDQLVFYVDNGLARPAILANFPDARVITVPTSRLGRKRYLRSVLPSFRPINPSRKDINVLLQYDASFGIPKKLPNVVIFHDLIPYLFRGQEKQRNRPGLRKSKDALARSMYWKKYLRVLDTYRYATKIIAISKSSKRDLLKHIKGVKAANVTIITHGISGTTKTGRTSAKVVKLAAKPYILYVGGIDIRKNIVGLLETFYELKPDFPDLRLIMVGKEFELKDQLESLGWFDVLHSNKTYAKDVVIAGYASAADLAYFYKHAVAFPFPSRYEGFGLPVLEAMQAGCPVVAYDNSSIPEVAGKAALLVPDGKPMAPTVAKLLKSPKLRKDLTAKGKAQAAQFPWSDTAQKTIKLLHQTGR